jgi:hypothetical protein
MFIKNVATVIIFLSIPSLSNAGKSGKELKQTQEEISQEVQRRIQICQKLRAALESKKNNETSDEMKDYLTYLQEGIKQQEEEIEKGKAQLEAAREKTSKCYEECKKHGRDLSSYHARLGSSQRKFCRLKCLNDLLCSAKMASKSDIAMELLKELKKRPEANEK